MSVISPASRLAGRAMISSRSTRAAEPAVSLCPASARASSSCRPACTTSSPSAPMSSSPAPTFSPRSRAASAAFSQASAVTKSRSWPARTASDRTGTADSSAVRTAPTRTKVPVASLKSSARRPRNTRPALGSPGSASAAASPVR